MSSMWSTPVFRWPEFNLSYLTSGWSLQSL
ncbi:hypothetical protein Goklo_017768, partial [Gossypium klotzschianum]|nr:hypothetical protein [Gossypium klotzschianum]